MLPLNHIEMKFDSIVNLTGASALASSSAYSPVVPGTTADKSELTQVDLTMSNESVDDSLSGSGGHSPSLLLSSDTSSLSLHAASSTLRKLSGHLDDKIDSCNNQLAIRQDTISSNHMLSLPRNLTSSSFSSNRPHYSLTTMPYSSSMKMTCKQPSQAGHMTCKQAFIHRSVSPCYLSNNSLSSSLSAISSSSVSSSSSSSDNDSLDELEHLASKFTHNIASIWSHSSEATSYLHPSIPGDSDNDTKQPSIYESRWMSHKQHNLLSQPIVDNVLDTSVLHRKPCTHDDHLPGTQLVPSLSHESHDAPSCTQEEEEIINSSKDKVAPQMSHGTNCLSIWSYDSTDDHTTDAGGKKKNNLKAPGISASKKNDTRSKCGKSKRDSCSMTRNSQVNLSGGNGIETIDLTEDDEAAACHVNLIDRLDQQAAAAAAAAVDTNGSILWLENHLRLASLNDTGDENFNLDSSALSHRGE